MAVILHKEPIPKANIVKYDKNSDLFTYTVYFAGNPLKKIINLANDPGKQLAKALRPYQHEIFLRAEHGRYKHINLVSQLQAPKKQPIWATLFSRPHELQQREPSQSSQAKVLQPKQ